MVLMVVNGNDGDDDDDVNFGSWWDIQLRLLKSENIVKQCL